MRGCVIELRKRWARLVPFKLQDFSILRIMGLVEIEKYVYIVS